MEKKSSLAQFLKILIVPLFVVIILLGTWYGKKIFFPHQTLALVPDRSHVQIKLGDCELLVEVVNTPASITQGLSGRENIGSDGMLFVMSQKTTHRFWMIDMQFPLDMVWLDDRTVVGITSQVPIPQPHVLPQDLPRYPSPQASNLVLELNADQATQCNIVQGEKLLLHILQ